MTSPAGGVAIRLRARLPCIRAEMILDVRSYYFRYALALWLATVLALFIAFFLQLEPAQWAAITVWIIFMQDPRMNYSKVIWWSFGTVVGAGAAVLFTVCFNQAPELFLLSLSLWLAFCAGTAKLVTSYRSYGWVLAGYTSAIVSMSGVDHPDLIFRIAITRVSCIFIGMASAILLIVILLPKHRHWRETLRRLGEHFRASLLQAAKALDSDATGLPQFTWRHMADRLSTLEHTLDITTAESADSRIHAPQARSLVATLFDLLAKAQAIEVHLSRPEAPAARNQWEPFLVRAKKLLITFAQEISFEQAKGSTASIRDEIAQLRSELREARRALADQVNPETISQCFVLDRLEELLEEFNRAIQDWSGLFGPWTARRESRLAAHQDFPSAFVYALRMFLAMTMAGVLWFVTQWPSGSQFILFIAVVCSLLSLVDYAPLMGAPFLKSAAFCALMAYVEAFWLFQKGEGFLSLALMLGLFLLPAANAYRHPRLLGGAVVSMLIFYGLSMPANQMNYDISAFLNNGLALLCAAACGFFAFHAVPSLDPQAKKFWLLRAVRRELAWNENSGHVLSEQSWTSRMFDRLRLLHQTAGTSGDLLDAENEMLVSLQLGLRQRRLQALLGELPPDDASIVAGVSREFRKIARHPNIVALFLRTACIRFEEMVGARLKISESSSSALAELWEMTFLLETTSRLYRE